MIEKGAIESEVFLSALQNLRKDLTKEPEEGAEPAGEVEADEETEAEGEQMDRE